MLHGVELYNIAGEGTLGGALTSQTATSQAAESIETKSAIGRATSAAGRMGMAGDPFITPEKQLLAPRQTFCRLFAKGVQHDPAALTRLGFAMESEDAIASKRDSSIPAGFTYFGQFVDHDVTFDKTPLTGAAGPNPGDTDNHRTPTLDLDSVYGGGPTARPDLYEADGATLKIGTTSESDDQAGQPVPVSQNDLPRIDGIAQIGDPRNDENLAVAQLHLAFLKFHNSFVAEYRAASPTLPAHSLFRRAREATVKHYQRIILSDYLPKIIDPNAIEVVLSQGHEIFPQDLHGFMPIEFSVAAFRMGHSMIRPEYEWNRVFNSNGGFTVATLGLLFEFTHFSGSTGPGDDPFLDNPTLPSNWPVDWRLLFEIEDEPPVGFPVNRARKLDTNLTIDLKTLPEFQNAGVTDPALLSLASRNLLRARLVELADGLAAADAIIATGMPIHKLTEDELKGGPHGAILEAEGMLDAPPLWYYILREAELEDGERLGPVGSRIVAETIIAHIRNSDVSILADGSIKSLPKIPRYTMSDMLKRVNDLNPVG